MCSLSITQKIYESLLTVCILHGDFIMTKRMMLPLMIVKIFQGQIDEEEKNYP